MEAISVPNPPQVAPHNQRGPLVGKAGEQQGRGDVAGHLAGQNRHQLHMPGQSAGEDGLEPLHPGEIPK